MKEKEFRIIGNASETEKKRVQEKFFTALTDHAKSLTPEEHELVTKVELKKTAEEEELIKWINEVTNEFLQEIGVRPQDIPTVNFHILPRAAYTKIARPESVGLTVHEGQGAILDGSYVRQNLLRFGTLVIHEMLHLKEPLTLKVNNQEEPSKTEFEFYRVGVVVISPQSKAKPEEIRTHFSGLEEAIIATVQKKLLPQLLNHPLLSTEKSVLESDEFKQSQEDAAKHFNLPPEEIIYFTKTYQDSNRTVEKIDKIPYYPQRRVLQYVCEQIREEFSEQYQTIDDVMQEFFKANFTGKLLTLGRLMKKTFGKNGFRILGMMTPDPDSAINCLETLQKARLEVKKQKKV